MEPSQLNQLFNESNRTKEPNPMKADNSISFDQFKDQQFGPEGSPERIDFQSKAIAFRISKSLRDYRKKQNMTQEDLAKKIGSHKAYISRIENGADMQLSTLYKLFQFGLGLNLMLVIGEALE